MHDEIDCLRTCPDLQRLLSHYVRLATPDREVWQDRLMALDGVEPAEMTKLHGDLLAAGWIEWTSSPKRSSACYRVTNDGLKASRLIAALASDAGLEEQAAIVESTNQTFSRRNRKRNVDAGLAISLS